MTCDDREQLINAYVDSELDETDAVELETHINTCKRCATTLASLRALKQSLSAPELRFQMPEHLEQSVLRGIPQKGTNDIQPSFETRAPSWVNILLAGGSLAVLLILGLFVGVYSRVANSQSHESQLADQVVSSHIRSFMANHLVDVASTDQHTVKPWFDGKLDFAAPVVDLTSQGFPLVGGRLDYMDNRPVAAMVYRRFKHVINVFAWPSSADEPASEPVKTLTRRGYNIEYWRSNGMTYWAISDVNSRELATLCALIGTGAGGTPEK